MKNKKNKGEKMTKGKKYAVILHGVSNHTGEIQTYITNPYTKAYANKLVENGTFGNLFKNGQARILKNEKYNSLKSLVIPHNTRGITELELVELI
tara:strand:+ start:170 stop:454 length:285 start_codon:yes stop_codon:yes gene_type:complete